MCTDYVIVKCADNPCPDIHWLNLRSLQLKFIPQNEKSAPATTPPTPGTGTLAATAAGTSPPATRPPSPPAQPPTTPTPNPGIPRRHRREIQMAAAAEALRTSRSGGGGGGRSSSTCRTARSPGTASELESISSFKHILRFPVSHLKITSPFTKYIA